MLIVILVIAILILSGFGFVWWKDRNRTQEQAGDAERLDP